MKRILKVLSLVGMSSVSLYAIPWCGMGPDGFSIIRTISFGSLFDSINPL